MANKNEVYFSRLPLFVLLFGWGLYHLIVAFGNITDYNTNFEFVKHVMSMDSIFQNSSVGYRSISIPLIHHITYIFIIILEAMIAIFGLIASVQFYVNLSADTDKFNEKKKTAYVAITLGILLWFISFSIVGAEWFSMWQSQQWNAIDTANRLLIIDAILYALVIKVK
jgi:predicted small integral membrane protein